MLSEVVGWGVVYQGEMVSIGGRVQRASSLLCFVAPPVPAKAFTRVVCETGREHPYPSIPGRSTLEYLQFNRNVTLLSSPVTAHVGVGGWIEKGPLV